MYCGINSEKGWEEFLKTLMIRVTKAYLGPKKINVKARIVGENKDVEI